MPLSWHRPTRLPVCVWTSCKRLGYAKADSCPPPAAIDCAACYRRGNAVLPLTVQLVTVHVVERPEPAYTRSHVAKLRQG